MWKILVLRMAPVIHPLVFTDLKIQSQCLLHKAIYQTYFTTSAFSSRQFGIAIWRIGAFAHFCFPWGNPRVTTLIPCKFLSSQNISRPKWLKARFNLTTNFSYPLQPKGKKSTLSLPSPGYGPIIFLKNKNPNRSTIEIQKFCIFLRIKSFLIPVTVLPPIPGVNMKKRKRRPI